MASTPVFAEDGFWFYRSVAFSCHRTPVHNLLARLARQQRLARGRLGHHVVYLSSDPQQHERQWRQRQQAETAPVVPAVLPDEMSLPLALSLLVELIRSPHAAPASLVRYLRTKGLSASVQQLQALMDHLQLEQKRGTLQLAELLQELLRGGQDHLQAVAALPTEAVYTFDRLAELAETGQVLPAAIKTRLRRRRLRRRRLLSAWQHLGRHP